MVGGVLIIAMSYLISSVILLSAGCVGLMAVIYVLLKRGY